MRIQGKKITRTRGSHHCMAIVILYLFVMIIGVESERDEEESLLACLIDSGDINEKMAEFVNTNCRHELLQAKMHALREVPNHSEEISNSKTLERKMLDSSNVLCPEVKEMLVKCIREKNPMLPSSVDEKDLDAWYTRYLGSLFPKHYTSRGRELDEKSEKKSEKKHEKKSGKKSGKKSAKESEQLQKMLIAVAIIASATVIIAVLLCCCCCKCCGNGTGRGRNDERPLLSLSLSDNSTASSQKSFTLGNLMNEEKLVNQSFRSKSSNNGNLYVDSHALSNSKIDISMGATAGDAPNPGEHFVQVSPAMVGAPGLPPLKPPPGRRASSVTPPLMMASSPPSAPAPPVPPPKKPPGGPRPPAPGPPPPPPPGLKAGPRPPPAPGGAPPPRPPPMGLRPPRSAYPGPKNESDSCAVEGGDAGAAKTKLKPFFWDKVSADPNDGMVWHQINAGSFQFSEEMIESLFGYTPAGKNKNGASTDSSSKNTLNQNVQLIDPKKSQNLAILLKALNVTTEEVCDALEEGNELPPELIQNLIKMAPTSEEELKLRLYSGSTSLLGTAERFLKVLVDIPFAFKRLESLLFMCTLQEEASLLKDSFVTLEAACTELRKSRLFFKLLEAVLKTGNRMNDGTYRGGAQAFKLDTLLKLSDVKGVDGKTTLLHFVVQEIIRTEGLRAARSAREMRSMSSFKSEDLSEDSTHESEDHLRNLGLQVVSSLGSDLENVKKAAAIDADGLMGTVGKLGHALVKSQDFLNSDMTSVPKDNGFHQALKSFVQNAEGDVMRLLEEEKRITALVKSTADYFHGHAGKDEGLRLFSIVRDFLIMLDRVCKEVKNAPRKPTRTPKKDDSVSTPPDPRKKAPTDPRQRLIQGVTDQRPNGSSSDDDSD